MKVLYLTGMYPTPAFPQKGIFCHEQVKALRSLGVDVDVVVPVTVYDREGTPSQWELEDIKIRYVRYFKFPGIRLFEKIGLFLYWALRQTKIDFSKYDVIHADAPLPAGYAAMLLSKKYQIPYMIHCHGLDVFLDTDYGEYKNYPAIEKNATLVYEEASAIVGVSAKTLQNVCARLPVQQKCHVVYNGVDVEQFHAAEQKRTDGLRVVAVGNLIDLKGHDLSIAAVGELVKAGHRNIHLDIFGRGEKENALKALVRELDLEEFVSFKGYVHYDRIAEEIRKYDVFLLPSWYEAIGCVYLEAMASGVVTVGCWKQGIDEVIENEKNGFLARPKDQEDVVRILKKLYEASPEVMEEIARKGRETVAEGYTWKHSAESLCKVYQSLL